jgi:hypothetical protein
MFVLQMTRLYGGKTTKNHTIKVGILSECPILVYSIGNALPKLWDPRWPYGFNGYPIPLLLLLGWILMKVYPPSAEPLSWLRNEEKMDWWPQSSVGDNNTENTNDKVEFDSFN